MTRTFFRPFLATAASALVLAACYSADAPSETAEYEAVEDAAAETDTAMSEMDIDTSADANVDRDAEGGEVELDSNAITDIAAGDARFSTLVTALQAANLTDTLDNTNVEYTVFAPTNEAFNNLPEGALVDLLQPEQQQQLQTVLTYHVVPGKVMATDLAEAIRQNGGSYTIDTVVEEDLTATIEEGMVVLTDTAGNTARVIDTDIEASNGVIHVIDTVVLPNS